MAKLNAEQLKKQAQVEAIHADLRIALNEIAKRHGIASLTAGRLSYNDLDFTVKVTGNFGVATTTGTIEAKFVPPWPFNDTICNAEVEFAGHKFKIIGAKRTNFTAKMVPDSGQTHLINMLQLERALKRQNLTSFFEDN